MTTPTSKLYNELFKLSKQAAIVDSIQQTLGWDQEIYMPPAGIEVRSSQIEWLAKQVQRQRTSQRFAKALGSLIDLETGHPLKEDLSAMQRAALREWRRNYLQDVKLPLKFVEKWTRETSTAEHVWVQARKENRFSLFAPHLEKIVSLARKKADLLGFKEHPYDALLDLYEPGMTIGVLNPLFDRLREGLVHLLRQIESRPPKRSDFLEGDFPKEKQWEFGLELLKAMGFSPETSRLDISPHPFCSGIHPKDLRMSSRLYPNLITPHIFAVLHEGGHGLYHSNLPEKAWGSPLWASASLGMDESQSRFWETILGHSLPFWKYFYPRLQKVFREPFEQISLHEFYEGIHVVKPTLIRVEADEVTYSLHVILRFEIEKALLEGTLRVKDIPHIWNEKMQQLLRITPPSDSMGCLQDIHWSMGGLGYFPTYTLGNLYGAQIFATLEKERPEWAQKVEGGDLGFVCSWLTEHIYRHGREFPPLELLQKVTHHGLSEKPHLDYLHKKYGKIYGF